MVVYPSIRRQIHCRLEKKIPPCTLYTQLAATHDPSPLSPKQGRVWAASGRVWPAKADARPLCAQLQHRRLLRQEQLKSTAASCQSLFASA